MEKLLSVCGFTAEKNFDEDGSIILCLNEIEFLIETGKDEDEALTNMAKAILEYAGDYYSDLAFWSRGRNTKGHMQYVMKALALNDVEKIKDLIKCQPGEI